MIWAKVAAALMFVAVAAGAFGAHVLRAKISPASLEIYKTAVLYQMVHAMGLFAVAWLSTVLPDPKVSRSGLFLFIGICLFSGSLYGLALTEAKWLGPLTPLGGLLLLAGWGLLAFSSFR